jgi:hypothetical protein
MSWTEGARSRAHRLFDSRVALAALVVMICAGIFVPIYTDEIMWRFHERAAIDGVDILWNDLCGPNTLARPVWFMWPVRWFSAAMNLTFAAPVFVRLEGILCALLWVALFWRLAARAQTDPARTELARLLGIVLLSLGVMPFIMVMSRPEQPLTLAVTSIVLLTLSEPWRWSPQVSAWLKCADIVLLATIALSYCL